jgi:hypothetical protein
MLTFFALAHGPHWCCAQQDTAVRGDQLLPTDFPAVYFWTDYCCWQCLDHYTWREPEPEPKLRHKQQKIVCGHHQGVVERYLVDAALGGDASLRIAAMMNNEFLWTNSIHTSQ